MSLRSEIVRIFNELVASGKKISQLPPASTPLAGSELLELSQNGVSVQVTAANLSSGGTGVQSVVAGDNILIDDTDPQNPIISSIASGSVSSVTGAGVNNTDPANPVISYPTTTDIGAENVANKATDFSTVNNTLYPSVQAVQNAIVAQLAGLSWKAPVVVATTANIVLSGEQTIDGVLTSASRVLVKSQSTASENGIYVSASGAWIRSPDANTGTELEGATVTVQEGTANANTTWVQTTDNITVGSSNIVWTQFGSSVPDASPTVKGIARLYSSTSLGTNTDGAPDQNAVKTYVDAALFTTIVADATTARTLATGDNLHKINFTNSGAITITLDNTVAPGTSVLIWKEAGSGVITLTVSGTTLKAVSTQMLTAQTGAVVVYEGGNVWSAYGALGLSTVAIGNVTGLGTGVATAASENTNVSGGLVANPMTTLGDIIVAGASGVAGRLAKGTALQSIRVDSSGNTLEYYRPATSRLANAFPALAVGGTTTETRYSGTILIPANTIIVGDVLRVSALVTKTGNTDAYNFRVRYNTTDNLSGATQIAIATPSVGGITMNFVRTYNVKTTSQQLCINTATNSATDVGVVTSAFSTAGMVLTADVYLLLSIEMGGTTDTATLQSFTISLQ